MEYFLLTLATAASATKALVCRSLGTRATAKRRVLQDNAFIFLFSALAVLVASAFLGGLSFSYQTVLIGVGFAASLLFTQLMQMIAMGRGPASVTTLIYSYGFIVPIVYSAIALGEEISVMQYVGIGLSAVSLFFIVSPQRDRRASLGWLLVAMLSALGSGMNAVIQKLHRAVAPEGEITSLLLVSFTLAALFSFGFSLLAKGEHFCDGGIAKRLGFVAFSGGAIGGLNILNLIIAGKLPAVVQFPIYNIGSLIIVGLVAGFVYKDRVSIKQLIGFVIGTMSVLTIGLL